MKICPQCQKAYDDATLNFCLEDGSLLTESKGISNIPPETVVIDSSQTVGQNKAFGTQPFDQTWETTPQHAAQETGGSKAWIWVLGMLIGAVVLCGGGLMGLVAIGVMVDNKKDDPVPKYPTTKSSPTIRIRSPKETRKLVSSHDFRDWNIENNQYIKSRYSNGELVLESSKNYYYVILTKNYFTKDASIKLTLRNTTGGASRLGYGLVINSDPHQVLVKDYAFLIRSDTQQYRVVRHLNKREIQTVVWTRSTAIKKGILSNVLEVRVSGNDMRFYINGVFVRSIRDYSSSEGSVAGIYTSGDMPIGFSRIEYWK